MFRLRGLIFGSNSPNDGKDGSLHSFTSFTCQKKIKKEQEELVKVCVFVMRKKTKESNNH
jgi:hypothetical protein